MRALPPPGDYFPERSTKHVFDSAPSHSISARTKTFQVDSTPGSQDSEGPRQAGSGPGRAGTVGQPDAGPLEAGSPRAGARGDSAPLHPQAPPPTCCPW